MNTIKTILHPTDFSERSELAFDLAGAIARDQNARLVVLHVVPISGIDTSAATPREIEVATTRQQELKDYRAEIQAKLRHMRSPGYPVRFEHLIQEGETGEVILKTADDISCDLIVMGTHGRSGASRAMMGSVAHFVSRKAVCPVLTLKMPLKVESSDKPTVCEFAGVV